MTSGKLQSHFGCGAFIALLKISRMRPLPGLDCRVGVPSEPCRLCQECEIFGRQRCFGVSLPKRSDGVVPCVPAVRVATLLNAILDELTHLAPCRPKWLYPTTLHGMQRKCGRPPLGGLRPGCPDDLSYALSGHASIATTADTDQHLVGTIAQKAVECSQSDCTQRADTTRCEGSMRTSRSAAGTSPTRRNIGQCWRGAIGSAAVL